MKCIQLLKSIALLAILSNAMPGFSLAGSTESTPKNLKEYSCGELYQKLEEQRIKIVVSQSRILSYNETKRDWLKLITSELSDWEGRNIRVSLGQFSSLRDSIQILKEADQTMKANLDELIYENNAIVSELSRCFR